MKAAVLLVAVVLLLSGCTNQDPAQLPEPTPPAAPGLGPLPDLPPGPQDLPVDEGAQLPASSWAEAGLVIPGNYADAEAVALADGTYRMYYALEPEVAGFKGQVYASRSSDGLVWTDEGEVKDGSTFPSVITTPSGYRMYFQNAGAIKSATSPDGLAWTDDAGTRVDATNTLGLVLENVAAPTVLKVGNEFIMVYRGTINEKYASDVPNSNTQLFLWATSADGLTFEKKGIALDSRNAVFQGLLDGPEFVAWDDGTVRLYFWSYLGVYHVTFDGTAFSQDAELDFTTGEPNSLVKFPPNPPGDPTLLKAGAQWYLYYGGHTQGIFAAALEE